MNKRQRKKQDKINSQKDISFQEAWDRVVEELVKVDKAYCAFVGKGGHDYTAVGGKIFLHTAYENIISSTKSEEEIKNELRRK